MVTVKTTLAKWGSMYIAQITSDDEETLRNYGGRRFKAGLNKGFFHCALNRNKEGAFVYINKKTVTENQLRPGDELILHFEKDETAHQFEVPESFQEVMNTDPEAEKIFYSLTPGRRRSILTFVLRTKNVDLQIERSLRVADYLKAGQTDPRLWK